MHQADQGVFKSILGWAVEMLEQKAYEKGGGILQNSKIKELNRCVLMYMTSGGVM
jgi:hypothetical protein